MKLFKSSKGFVISFGFDMLKRKPNIHIISWCDPSTGEWESAPTNQAGWNEVPWVVDPEFVFECGDHIVAYQPGRCTEMTYVGSPMIWTFRTFAAEPNSLHLAA